MNETLTHRLFRDDIADGILELVEKKPGITTGEIEKAICLSDAGARYRLLSLEAAQLIRRERIRGRCAACCLVAVVDDVQPDTNKEATTSNRTAIRVFGLNCIRSFKWLKVT